VSEKDLYAVLGIKRDASDAEIKSAYRSIARKNHPDVKPDNKVAEERFKTASAAFEILSDKKKRALYDEFGDDALRLGFDADKARSYRQYKRQAARGQAPRNFDLNDLFTQGPGKEGFSFSDLGDVISDLFGNSAGPGAARQRGGPVGRGPTGRPQGAGNRGAAKGQARSPLTPENRGDVETQVEIPLRHAVLGGEVKIKVERPGRETPSQLTVKIPVGIREGQKIRLSGQGVTPPGRSKAGDLLIEVKIKEDPTFRRDDDDLFLTLPLSFAEAALGASIKVATLAGEVTVKVPAGTPSGRRLRLKGQGVPAHKKQDAGHLYVEIQILAPTIKEDSSADPIELEALKRSLAKLEDYYSDRDRERLKRTRG